MKRICSGVLVLALSGIGCISFPGDWQKKPTATPPATTTSTPATTSRKPMPTVSGDQITESNAWQMADALREEMDRDAQGEVPTTPAKKPAK